MTVKAERQVYKWLVLATVASGVFMAVVDAGVVNISLPAISSHFDADLPTVQWVVSVYLLTITALLLPLGRAADLLGRKRLYVAGFAAFIVGAVLAASAQNVPWLLMARALQAVGAASIQANGLAITVSVFPPEERGKVLGLTATVVALGAISGPVFGGILVDAFGWRSVFFLSVVVGLLGVTMARFVLKEERIATALDRRGKLDWLGMVTSAVAMASVLLVLSRGHSAGWTSPSILVTGAVAAVAIGAFFLAELRVKEPMIDLGLFRRRAFALGSLAAFLAFVAVVANAIMMPFYLQGVLGYQARTAGLVLTPWAFMLAFTGALAGRFSDKIEARVLSTLGMLVVCGALLALSRLGAHSSVAHVVIPLMALGAGMGMFSPANQNSVIGAVERERYGLVSAFLNLMRNTGNVAGIALATLIVTLSITSLGVEPDLGILREEGAAANPLLVQGFVSGLRQTFLISAGIVALAALASAFRGARRVESLQPATASVGANPNPVLAEPGGKGAS